jgi:glucose/arabinose dehydrogenase
VLASGLAAPTIMEFDPNGRALVCEQGGRLRIVENGSLLPDPALTLNVDSRGERGLLGLALDPQFGTNGFLYLYYTVPGSPPHNRVSRFILTGSVVTPSSEVVLLELSPLSAATNHNGGCLGFGPDGALYVSSGENANPPHAQSLANTHGKILRIRPDGSIPDDNPFLAETTGVARAIWALGLRNPFRFDFENGSGRMLINDVGQNTFEEINLGVAGANYGWPATEGPTTDPRFRSPVLAYRHSDSSSPGCAITGGTFLDAFGTTFPGGLGRSYFYADLCGGWIRRLGADLRSDGLFATGLRNPVALTVGPDGALFALEYTSGAIQRFAFSGTEAPVGLGVLRLAPGGLTLAWTDRSSRETGYVVEGRFGRGSFRRLGQAPANATQLDLSGLRVNTEYALRVRAAIAGASEAVSEEISVTVPAPGKLVIAPAALTLRATPSIGTASGEVNFSNAGAGPLTITLTAPDDPFSLEIGTPTSFVLAPRERRKVPVRFLPPGMGRFTGSLGVASDDPTRRAATVRLVGQAR